MRSVLFLLILALMTGCEARSEPKGCREGWAEFVSGKSVIRSTKKEKDGCPGPFIQTAYKTAKTTITCDYPGKKNESSVHFFCKDNKSIYEDISSTKSSPKSNRRFTLTKTSSGFSISISNVSKDDAGVYWCGVRSNDGRYRAALRSIQLNVEGITSFKKNSNIGQNLTYYCAFWNDTPIEIFICKGEDPSICQPLVTSTQPDNTGKFSMKRSEVIRQQSKTNFNFSITVREVTAHDSGIYWCGAESKDKTRSNLFFHKFLMTVEPTPTPTSRVSSTKLTTSTSAEDNEPTPTPTSRVSSTKLTTSTSAEDNGGSHVVITVIVFVAVLLLVLTVLILILIYKRFLHSKNTRNGATAQYIKEDYIYEEIQERVQNPDSGDAVNTIYVTANFPTNPSASLHYSTITFKNCSNKPGGEELIVKPRSACEYSTVKHSESPIYSTVNKPSRSSQEPCYSTVNNKQ